MKVEAILKHKGRAIVTVRPQASVAIVLHRLEVERIGSVVVSEDNRHLQGMLTERDIVFGLAEFGSGLFKMRVQDLMVHEVPTCGPSDSVRHVMAQMTRHRVRHLPVLENGQLCGILSIGDVVKSRLDEMELETSVLRDAYAAG